MKILRNWAWSLVGIITVLSAGASAGWAGSLTQTEINQAVGYSLARFQSAVELAYFSQRLPDSTAASLAPIQSGYLPYVLKTYCAEVHGHPGSRLHRRQGTGFSPFSREERLRTEILDLTRNCNDREAELRLTSFIDYMNKQQGLYLSFLTIMLTGLEGLSPRDFEGDLLTFLSLFWREYPDLNPDHEIARVLGSSDEELVMRVEAFAEEKAEIQNRKLQGWTDGVNSFFKTMGGVLLIKDK